MIKKLSLLLVAAVLLSACSHANPTPSPEANSTTSTTQQVPADPGSGVDEMVVNQEGVMEGSTKTFDMTAKQWEFEPSTITVNEGDTVTLNISSTDVDHGFAIPQFNVNQNLKAGTTTTVTFTADKAGSYTFFCSVQCGQGHSGMKGTLIVQ